MFCLTKEIRYSIVFRCSPHGLTNAPDRGPESPPECREPSPESTLTCTVHGRWRNPFPIRARCPTSQKSKEIRYSRKNPTECRLQIRCRNPFPIDKARTWSRPDLKSIYGWLPWLTGAATVSAGDAMNEISLRSAMCLAIKTGTGTSSGSASSRRRAVAGQRT